jgi:hypothetical protein
MIDPKIETAFQAALEAFSKYNSFDATVLTGDFGDVFVSDEDFLTKVDALDEVFDNNPQLNPCAKCFLIC